MEIGKLGVWWFLDALKAPDTAAFAQKVERLGYSALWIPEAVGRDPFPHAAYLLANTDRLIVATGIANIFARGPMAMYSGARTLAEQSGGRFVLGIGVSHAPLVEKLRGMDYTKPYSTMKTYLAQMKASAYQA
jgi:alkanesulfonate monooxygenase SsuD/methylene tetrahydromethanopterin reductase-like flavin-dependent oxidoreductase (luciferase family)